MEITLTMIEEVKKRTGKSFEKTAEALKAADGDVIKAVTLLEREEDDIGKADVEDVYIKAGKIFEKVKDLVAEGNEIKVRIKKKDKTIVEMPVAIGALSAIIAPYLALLGGIAAIATKCSVEVNRDTISDINLDSEESVVEVEVKSNN